MGKGFTSSNQLLIHEKRRLKKGGGGWMKGRGEGERTVDIMSTAQVVITRVRSCNNSGHFYSTVSQW